MYFHKNSIKERTRWRISRTKNRIKPIQQIFTEQQIVKQSFQLKKPFTSKLISRDLNKSTHNTVNILSDTNTNFNQMTNLKKSSTKKFFISEEQREKIHNVFPKHLTKKQILGKGAVSIIWLAYDHNLQKEVAVKQFLKDCKQSYQRERRFVKELDKINITNNFIKFNYFLNIGAAEFMIYQVGGKSLSKALYQIKGEFYNHERVYKVVFTDLYWEMIKPENIKKLIKQLAQGVLNLQKNNFSHNDLKPENLLIDENNNIKICDYGSITTIKNSELKNMITPEYMPPEVLMGYESKQVDVWSIGIIIIQLLNGIPIWMFYKCWINEGKHNILSPGLLAVKGKSYEKILSKIQILLNNIKKNINFGISNYEKHESECLIDLLKRILQINPDNRYSPQQILGHQFLNS